MPGDTTTKIAPSWAGRPPSDDAEASQRIRDAARRCIDRGGVNVRIAEVARELGVSRPTVYRHYPSGQAVLKAVALESIQPLLTRVATMDADPGAAPADIVAEIGCLLFQWLCRDAQLRQLTRFGPGGAADNVTSGAALLLTRGLIERARLPLDDSTEADHLNELAELVTRLVHSMIERPPTPSKQVNEQCETLRRWIRGAVDGILSQDIRVRNSGGTRAMARREGRT